jgi:hypothetical protein
MPTVIGLRNVLEYKSSFLLWVNIRWSMLKMYKDKEVNKNVKNIFVFL